MSTDEFPLSFCLNLPLSHSSIQKFSTLFSSLFFLTFPFPFLSLLLFLNLFLTSCVSVFFWFPLSLPFCHLLFIKPVFNALLFSQKAPPQGSVYMVSYCAIPCVHTCAYVCVCVLGVIWYTHSPIHTGSRSRYCTLLTLSADTVCLLSHSQSVSPLSDKPIPYQLSPLHCWY